MKNNTAVDVFDDWALSGKDEGMEKGHNSSVDRMIELAKEINFSKDSIRKVLDLGCGNGWMANKLSEVLSNINYLGVDGAMNMIDKAKNKNPNNQYLCVDINNWIPSRKFDLVMSMEVLYYLDNPKDFLRKFYLEGVENEGALIIGMDHYKENPSSLNWPEQLDVNMHTFKIEEWVDMFYKAGFSDVYYEQYNAGDNWEGTLILKAIKN